MKEKKLYVLVRKDLRKSQQAVQAGHAIAEYLLTKKDVDWYNGTLVYLQVQDEDELFKWFCRYSEDAVGFREPDMGGQITAMAVVSYGEEFKKLKLL